VKTPEFYVCSSAGIIRDNNYSEISEINAVDLLKNVGEVFIKPTVDSSSGEGCRVAIFVDGIDTESQSPIKEYLMQLGSDWVIQKRLRCSESIRRIYPNSVNTFRVITYRWKNSIYSMPVIMRIGRNGNYLDNAHAGGMFIAVDDDGTLHDRAFTEFKEEFTKHPDTGVVFKNYKIENFSQVLEAAKRMSSMVPQVGCINWDFTIDDRGEPVLIEGNMKFGSTWLIEMAHGVAPFGERTEEVLQWLRKMRKTKASERYKYLYGKE
jgi:hypothetical protein